MKNINVNFKKLLLIGALGGTLVLTTGCNRNILIGAQSFDKAIIFNDNNAAVLDIASWKDFNDGEQLELTTKDGMVILTSAYDTKLINSNNSDKSVEDLCKAILGEDATISYFDKNVKVKVKDR